MSMLPDNIRKYLNMTTLVVTLAAGLIISILVGVNIRSKLSIVRSELVASKVMYTLVENEKHRLDSLIGFYTQSIDLRDSIIAIRDREISEKVAKIINLETNLKKLKITMVDINADSSYKYINTVIPKTSEQNYGFDSTQVKSIHHTFLERDALNEINFNYSLVTADLLRESKQKDLQITDLKNLNGLYLSKEAILNKDQEANAAKIKELNKALKQQKRQKNWLIGGVAGVATVIIIKSISQ